MKSVWVMGLMSGTSLDGVDAALLKTDGITVAEKGPSHFLAYTAEFRQRLYKLIQNPFNNPSLGIIEQELTTLHEQAVRELIAISGITPEGIGFHGQTIYHHPKSEGKLAQTWKIGDGQMLATALAISVVYDFRRQDVEHGGEGAPLVPIYHWALAKARPKPLAIVNIGGVANITVITAADILHAGDVGTGGALIDDWMVRRTGQPYDKDGQMASQGRVCQDLLEHWLNHPFFERSLPKSLDRQTFYDCLTDCEERGLSTADGAATLTAFTARGILKGLVPYLPLKEIILTGGGRHNLFLRRLLSEIGAEGASAGEASVDQAGSVESCSIKLTEEVGWCGDKLEAEAFAYLALRSIRALPITFPTTTGVAAPLSGGRVIRVGS